MMLELDVPEVDHYDKKTKKIVTYPAVSKVRMEHSLISISKWEAKWHKPFIPTTDRDAKTPDQMVYYYGCMLIGQYPKHLPWSIYMSKRREVWSYITDPQSATVIVHRNSGKKSRNVITSEDIYEWMVRFGIPWEAEKWHINRLIILIELCRIANSKGEKMPEQEALAKMNELNRKRRRAGQLR